MQKETTEFDGFEPPEQTDFVYDMPIDDISQNEHLNAHISNDRKEQNMPVNNTEGEITDTNEYNKVINNWTEIIVELQNRMHLKLYLHISQAVPVKSKNGIVLQFPDKQSKQSFDAAHESEILSEVILSVTGIKADISTAVIGEDSYYEPQSDGGIGDIFSDLAKHSGEFPNNITID